MIGINCLSSPVCAFVDIVKNKCMVLYKDLLESIVRVFSYSQGSAWNPKERNNFSVGFLWYGFLRYYTEEFDFEHDVVCCRRTKKLTKFEKMWTKHVFAIEGKVLLFFIASLENTFEDTARSFV